MITIKLQRMASEVNPRRVDVWIEDDADPEAFGYIGEVSLSTEEFDRLVEADRNSDFVVEVTE